MDNIQIFNMNLSDVDDVLMLEKSHNIRILSKSILLDDLRKDNYYYIVAKTHDKIVGYAGISYIFDSADLISIVVDKNHTKHGVATQMLNNIYEFCMKNKISKLMLEVKDINAPAINLYLKHGFNQISIRKKYYSNTHDALIMEKIIPIN